MSAPLVLVAASGLAREVLAALEGTDGVQVRGLLDDAPNLQGTAVGGAPVLGTIDAAADHPDATFLVCAGRGLSRAAIVARLAAQRVDEERYTTFVHPDVRVPSTCTVGRGSVLLAGAVLTTDVHVGRHVVVMPNVTLTHDDAVEDFATLCAGVALGGHVTVRRHAYLGMGSSVREHTTVGPRSVLGMGAVLLSDLPADQTWTGVPARPRQPVTTSIRSTS